jgi:hypothetical protein
MHKLVGNIRNIFADWNVYFFKGVPRWLAASSVRKLAQKLRKIVVDLLQALLLEVAEIYEQFQIH